MTSPKTAWHKPYIRDIAAKTSYSVYVATENYFVDIKAFIDTDSKHNLSFIISRIAILKISSIT